jgi:hypothetical protein
MECAWISFLVLRGYGGGAKSRGHEYPDGKLGKNSRREATALLPGISFPALALSIRSGRPLAHLEVTTGSFWLPIRTKPARA